LNITLDIKTLIAIAGIVAAGGGAYYSTQHRLDHLEAWVEQATKTIDQQAVELKQFRRHLKRHNK